MPSQVRKLVLTAHIAFSVGWIGAVAGFLVLSIAGLTSQNASVVHGAYVAVDLIGRFTIVPLGLAALTTGLVQALGTEWGLFRHYWILTKFLLTIVAIIGLLLHQFTAVAEAANLVSQTAAGTLPSTELSRLGTQLVGDASLAILLLLAATTLSVYKPWGRTTYGRRKQQERREQTARSSQTLQMPSLSDPLAEIPDFEAETISQSPSLSIKIAVAVIGLIVSAFVLLHLAGGGLGSHGR